MKIKPRLKITLIAPGVTALVFSLDPQLSNDKTHCFPGCSVEELGAPGRDAHHDWRPAHGQAKAMSILPCYVLLRLNVSQLIR